MDHHRSGDGFRIIVSLGPAIFKLELFRELEIELDGRTLEGPAQRVLDGNINLGPIKCAVLWVELPFTRIMPFEHF